MEARRWVKTCSCGAHYTPAEWHQLSLVVLTWLGEPCEIRNCSSCDSSLAIERPSIGDLAVAA